MRLCHHWLEDMGLVDFGSDLRILCHHLLHTAELERLREQYPDYAMDNALIAELREYIQTVRVHIRPLRLSLLEILALRDNVDPFFFSTFRFIPNVWSLNLSRSQTSFSSVPS